MNNYDDKDYMTVGNLITHLQKMVVEGKTKFESPVLWYSEQGEYHAYQKPEKCIDPNLPRVKTLEGHGGTTIREDSRYLSYLEEKAIVL